MIITSHQFDLSHHLSISRSDTSVFTITRRQRFDIHKQEQKNTIILHLATLLEMLDLLYRRPKSSSSSASIRSSFVAEEDVEKYIHRSSTVPEMVNIAVSLH